MTADALRAAIMWAYMNGDHSTEASATAQLRSMIAAGGTTCLANPSLEDTLDAMQAVWSVACNGRSELSQMLGGDEAAECRDIVEEAIGAAELRRSKRMWAEVDRLRSQPDGVLL